MEELLAALASLAAHHAASKERDFDALLAGVTALTTSPPEPQFQYRHNLGWDETWMPLRQDQLSAVLKLGHPVERRRILGGWERYTGEPS